MKIFKYSILQTTYEKVDLKQVAKEYGADIKQIQIHLNDISELIDENKPFFYTTEVLAPETALDIKRGLFDKYYSEYPILVTDENNNVDFFYNFNTVCEYYNVTEDELENALIGKNNHKLGNKQFDMDILSLGSDI